MKLSGVRFDYLGDECWFQKNKYVTGNLRLDVFFNQGPMAVLSVNVPGTKLPRNGFVCKNYSENETIARCAFDTGLFEDTSKIVDVGYCKCPIWILKEDN